MLHGMNKLTPFSPVHMYTTSLYTEVQQLKEENDRLNKLVSKLNETITEQNTIVAIQRKLIAIKDKKIHQASIRNDQLLSKLYEQNVAIKTFMQKKYNHFTPKQASANTIAGKVTKRTQQLSISKKLPL